MRQVKGVLDLLCKDQRARLKKKDKNLLIAICGPTGSGKSSTAIAIAEKIDPKFNADQIVYSAKEFIMLLDSGKLKKGSCVVWDEAGIGLESRAFMTISNRLLAGVLQTYRHLNLCTIFTVPYLHLLDKTARVLTHVLIDIRGIDYDTKHVICKWQRIQYNEKMDKFYYHNPWVQAGGQTVKVTHLRIPHAPKEIWAKYQKQSFDYKRQVREEALRVINEIEAKREAKSAGPDTEAFDNMVNTVYANQERYQGTRGKLKHQLISVEFGVTEPMAKKIIAKCELVDKDKRKKNT